MKITIQHLSCRLDSIEAKSNVHWRGSFLCNYIQTWDWHLRLWIDLLLADDCDFRWHFSFKFSGSVCRLWQRHDLFINDSLQLTIFLTSIKSATCLDLTYIYTLSLAWFVVWIGHSLEARDKTTSIFFYSREPWCFFFALRLKEITLDGTDVNICVLISLVSSWIRHAKALLVKVKKLLVWLLPTVWFARFTSTFFLQQTWRVVAYVLNLLYLILPAWLPIKDIISGRSFLQAF
jgi:hypothetical protein